MDQNRNRAELGMLSLSVYVKLEPQLLFIRELVYADISGARTIIKVSGHQHQWLAGGYDLDIGLF